MKIDEMSLWEAYLGVAKHGNFSKASKALGLGVPQVSKRVSRLEEHLGTRLFQRSTRSVVLTNEGKSILPTVASVLEDLRSLEAHFEDKQQLSGTIRMTCVPFLAHRLLLDCLSQFMAMNPKIRIDLELSESRANLIESSTDIAIRIQKPVSSDLIYRKLGTNALVICASPEYLKKAKASLKKADDLLEHNVLMLSVHKGVSFRNSARRLGDFSGARKLVCEDGIFLTEMALRGQGVLIRSKWDVADSLASGKLVQILKKHPLEDFGNIFAVIPSRRFLAPRVRALMDFIVAKVS